MPFCRAAAQLALKTGSPFFLVRTWLSLPSVALIVFGEGLAPLVFSRIARDFGATFVAFANFIWTIFATILGAVWIDDQPKALSTGVAIIIATAVALYQRFVQEWKRSSSFLPGLRPPTAKWK